MFSSFFASPETKECSDPVFTVEHRVDAVCALVADLMRLHDAITVLKGMFSPNQLTPEQKEALTEVFRAQEDLMGPDVDTDEDEPPSADENPIPNPLVNITIKPASTAPITSPIPKPLIVNPDLGLNSSLITATRSTPPVGRHPHQPSVLKFKLPNHTQ